MSFTPPVGLFPAFPLFTSAHPLSCGLAARLNAAAAVSVAWATANQARYVPFTITTPFLAAKLLAFNGATAGGNTDMGIYTAAGTEVVGIAAAAQSGLNTWQSFDITDTMLMPGLYYLGLLNTTTTGTYFSWGNLQGARAAGMFSQAVGAATLPTPTATFAALDAFGIPLVGISSRALI